MKENVIILTGSFGEGHKQVAQSIVKTIEQYQPLMNVQEIDFISWSHPLLSKCIANGFVFGVKTFPKLYGHLYQESNHEMDNVNWIKKLVHLESKKMALLIEETKPSAIVCALPYLSNIIASINVNKIPVVTVITDYAAHSAWIHPSVDLYLVGSKQVQQQLIDKGVSLEKIKCTGIPVKPDFIKNHSKNQIASKNKLKLNLPTLLIMGGGYGMIQGNAIVQMIREFTQVKLQIVIICGYNEKMKQQIKKGLKDSKHSILILGYVENVYEYMNLADLIVTKSGGVTVSEALVSSLPMLLISPIPGQEQKNAAYLVNQGAAVLATDTFEAKEQLKFLLLNPVYLKIMKNSAKAIAAPEAAVHIIHEVHSLIKNRSESITQRSEAI